MPVLIEVDDEGAFELGLGENHVCLPLEPYLIKLNRIGSRFVEWRMFLSANWYPLRRTMR